MVCHLNRAVRKGSGLFGLLLLALGASSAQAAPRPLPEWFAGQFEFVYAKVGGSELVLRDPAASAELHFRWDKHTAVFFHPGQKKPARFDAKAAERLQPGAPLRVLYVKHGNSLLARRVVE